MSGAFVLVKAETERVPNIAAGFGVRSIPAVFAVKDGRVVDSFVGVLPESAVQIWIEGLLPTPAEQSIAAARKLEATDLAGAERLYRTALELEPRAPAARIGLARVLVSRSQIDEAQKLITALEGRGFLEPEAEKLKAELALRAAARDGGDLAAARAEAAAHPDNPAVRFKLAEALAAAGRHAEALEQSLAIVEEGPKELREAARKLMLSLFQLLPEDSELVSEYRRKLSAALY
jgi:putative thioredoxin